MTTHAPPAKEFVWAHAHTSAPLLTPLRAQEAHVHLTRPFELVDDVAVLGRLLAARAAAPPPHPHPPGELRPPDRPAQVSSPSRRGSRSGAPSRRIGAGGFRRRPGWT